MSKYKTNQYETNTNKYYNTGKKEYIIKGSIVLCQHGFKGNDGTIDPLFENLKNNAFKSFYGCEFCNNTLKYSELSSDNVAVKEIEDYINKNPERNVFVKTLFSNSQYGHVTTQAAELYEMINLLKGKYPDRPIVLIGYSKGGVVNCKCAIEHEGLIDRIINIGTPHEDTLVQDIIQILGDAMKEKYGEILYIPNVPVQLAIQALVDLLKLGVDNVLNEVVTYKNLKNEWNNMSIRPKFIPIAGEAIVMNGEFNGDFVVPTESAIASGFRGRTYNSIIDNYVVKDERVSIDTSRLKYALANSQIAFELLENASEAIIGHNATKIVEVLYDIVTNIIENDGDLKKCLKLAHTPLLGCSDSILTHNTIAMRVLSGFNV